jgi:uncharacterized protein (TIGR03032 family)
MNVQRSTPDAFFFAEEEISAAQLEFEVSGDFWGVLARCGAVLAVSREYENFVVLLGGAAGEPWQAQLPIPHPSGMFWNSASQELIVASTRQLNQIFYFRLLNSADQEREILPDDMRLPPGDFFIPRTSVILPGSLYIHDIAMIGDELYATMTGHNFLGRIQRQGGWERVWWPSLLDTNARGFSQNHFQLNSVARAESVAGCFFTAFSDSTSGAKPWKSGFGPREKGVVFSGATRDVCLRGLTCPHSARLIDGRLWLCNSGFGETGFVEQEGTTGAFVFRSINAVSGFTRGLASLGDRYVAVGLSKVIPKYEPYAPGLVPEKTRCGVLILDRHTGVEVASLEWKSGYQIYDVQVLPGLRQPLLSHSVDGQPGNSAFRYYG